MVYLKKKVIKISSIIFEALLFTSAILMGILFFKMGRSFILKKRDYMDQIQMYLITLLLLAISGIDLNPINYDVYMYLSICLLGSSPYYLDIAKET